MGILQILVVAFVIFALSRTFLRFKDGKLSKKELLFWIILWAAIVVIALLPDLTSVASRFFGIKRGIDLILYISIVGLFYLIFRLYVKIDTVQKEITFLVREIALKKKKK